MLQVKWPCFKGPNWKGFFSIQAVLTGCLLQFIRGRRELAEKNEVILDMVLQICSAMQYLDNNGYIHRDLVC